MVQFTFEQVLSIQAEQVPSFKEICSLINETIDDFIENAEEYIENVKERDLYEQFVSCREQYRKSKEEKENANE